MTRQDAIRIAKDFNADPPESKRGVRFTPARQHWRDGSHWYVRGSDGCGVFKQ